MPASQTNQEQLRSIPSVNELIQSVQATDWASGYVSGQLLKAVRDVLQELRLRVLQQGASVPSLDHLAEAVHRRIVELTAFSLKRVINATGIIVHTNLGRAPLAQEAIDHMSEIASGYSNLEFNLEEGARGSRETHVETFLSQVVPSEASLVVNNNASALLLILNTFAEGKEVIVSRGELVEIGGSFRLPDIMKKSQSLLREVGTTNKTRLEDYRSAITENTGLILVVHPSNYQIIGFTEKVDAADLIALGAEKGIPVVEDHGSGILTDLAAWGIPGEPEVTERLGLGFDAVCFSGDKILGGPQAGIVCGKRRHIEKMRKNPLFRALRVDKLVYAALEATLRMYLTDRTKDIPVLRMLAASEEALHAIAERWQAELQKLLPGASVQVEQTVCYAGGGVAPMKGVDSCAVSIRHPKMPAQELTAALRKSDPPVVARIEEDRTFFELRTLNEHELPVIGAALQQILSPTS